MDSVPILLVEYLVKSVILKLAMNFRGDILVVVDCHLVVFVVIVKQTALYTHLTNTEKNKNCRSEQYMAED